MTNTPDLPSSLDVLVIGGGQAGLAAGYYLRQSDKTFLIVDANARVGDSWRHRWDSLELFTPRPFAALPGLKVSRHYHYYPKKDEIADYFAAYTAKFNLPVSLNTAVRSVEKTAEGFKVTTIRGSVKAKQVIIAIGPYSKPLIPSFADSLDTAVDQLHSAQYKRPAQITTNSVVVVGGGNSATQLAEELFAAGKQVTLISSRLPWFLPKTILGISSYWWFYLTGTLRAPRDARLSRYVRGRGDGIIGRSALRLIKSGRIIHIASRVVGASAEGLVLDNGRIVAAQSVVWATGFRPGYDWLHVPGTLDKEGRPMQKGGVSPVVGIYWVGLPWQTRLDSGIIHGAGPDAKRVVRRLLQTR